MLPILPARRWDYSAAAHLLNRAGFGGPPAEIEALHRLGLEGAVNRLLDFEADADPSPKPAWAKFDPERFKIQREMRQATPEKRRELQQTQQREQRDRLVELRHWWLARMASGKRPLQEKLTLFWHGHFATSAQKVKDAYLMWRQNDIFRRNAAGNWFELLEAVSKDPAMLIWLDQAQSRKEHPNENFAREVMELFTLGEGHYTEKDITEAARAFTGWAYDRSSQDFAWRPQAHDRGTKTILGKTGSFDGDAVLKILVEQPQAARFTAAKLWRFFADENPSEVVVESLATEFRSAKNEFKPLLKRMFMSEEFYAPSVIRNQVKSPTQWLISSVRLLERDLPPPQIVNAGMRALGQELFMPPNVKGWDGGAAWITTNNLLTRYNMTAYLALGENPTISMRGGNNNKDRRRKERRFRPGAPIDPVKLLSDDERSSKKKLVAALEKRFIQGPLKEKQRAALVELLEARGDLDEEDMLQAIRLVMCTPEFQLA